MLIIRLNLNVIRSERPVCKYLRMFFVIAVVVALCSSNSRAFRICGLVFTHLSSSSSIKFACYLRYIPPCRNVQLTSTQSVLKLPVPVVFHKPTPAIPRMELLQFEILLFVYLLCAMAIQHINIYKAVSLVVCLSVLGYGGNVPGDGVA